MDATIKSLLAKTWKNEAANLAPGRNYIDEEFVVRVTGSVEKLDDEMVAPTVSIPLIAALALFWEKCGIVRDKALAMLRESLQEAMTEKVKEDRGDQGSNQGRRPGDQSHPSGTDCGTAQDAPRGKGADRRSSGRGHGDGRGDDWGLGGGVTVTWLDQAKPPPTPA